MCEKSKKKWGGGGGGRGGRVLGGQGGCEWRSEANVKIQKKNFFFFLGGGSGQGVGLGGGDQGGWERRIEAFVKIQKKKWGGGQVGGGRVWLGGGFRVMRMEK